MVLHFVKDEKVTDQIIENFGKASKRSHFLVFLEKGQKNFDFIKSQSNKIIAYDQSSGDIMQLINKFKPQAIVLHSLQLDFAKAILSIKINLNIAWYPWGFDIYGLPKIKPKTYAPMTNKFLLSVTPSLLARRIILKNARLRRLYFYFITKDENRYEIIFKAIDKINFFASYLREDYDYFSKTYPNSLTFLYSPFSTISQYLAGNKAVRIKEDASSILIGNSNTAESNHLDVFETLNCCLDSTTPNVYVPLSYGGDLHYKTKVMEYGTKKLGLFFKPLLNFMDRETYISILTSCSTGIFYHYRQQAMGNIIAMLFMGCRIYLSKKNPAFTFFERNNIKVFDFDSEFKLYKNAKLDCRIANGNREKLNYIFNEDTVLKALEDLLITISK